jgi:hypothetical protein
MQVRHVRCQSAGRPFQGLTISARNTGFRAWAFALATAPWSSRPGTRSAAEIAEEIAGPRAGALPILMGLVSIVHGTAEAFVRMTKEWAAVWDSSAAKN